MSKLKILIAIALEKEFLVFLKTLSLISEEVINEGEKSIFGHKARVLHTNDREFVVVEVGKGPNASLMDLPNIVEEVGPDMVVNLGCAGSYKEFCEYGDVFLTTTAIDEERDTSIHQKKAPKRDVVPYRSNIKFLRYISDPKNLTVPTDEKYSAIVSTVLDETYQNYNSPKIISGTKDLESKPVVSGNVNHLPLEEHSLYNTHGKGFCCDQEAASIGQILSRLDIPFIFIKGISDFCFDKEQIDTKKIKTINH